MKRLALLLVVALCLPLTAQADDASRRAKAEEMLSLLHMDRLMSQMMDTVMQQTSTMTKQLLGGATVSPEQQARLDELQKNLFQLVESQMGWKALEPEYVTLYANNFTEEQLDGIIAFYKSPSGSALLDKMPAMTAEGMKISQARMTAMLPQLQQMMADFAKSAPKPKPLPKSTQE